MKTLSYVWVLLIVLFVGCTEKWDSHYGMNSLSDTTVVSPLNLLDYLKTQPQYSKFVEALERTKVAEELTRDQYLTVWAVPNGAMDALGSIDMIDTFVMKYHVNNLSFTYDKLRNGLRLKALNDKYIPVKVSESGEVSLANAKLVKANQICKNGVIQEIDQLMVPIISIYEYLQKLDDSYSVIRDSIFSQNDTVFDQANSIPLGVDQTGNTIYDSVFVIQNPILSTVDFRSEYSQVTMFLPSNQVINDCFENLKSQYQMMGKTVQKADSTLAFNWIKQAIFFKNVVEDYGSTIDISSAYNKVWRTSVQLVNPVPRTMSNGLIYYVTKMKIPTNVYLTRIKSLIHYYEFVPDELKPTLYKFENCTEVSAKVADSYSFPTINVSGYYSILYLKGADPKDGLNISAEFSPVKLQTVNGITTASEMLVPPGEYKLYMGFLSKNHAYVNIYFNGQPVAQELNVEPSSPWNYDRVNQTVSGTKWDGLGGLVGTVTIAGDQMTSFKIKVEFARLGKGTAEEMKLYHWALVPTANNY